MPVFRRLTQEDAAAYAELRRLSLQESPAAFGLTLPEQERYTADEILMHLASHHAYGAFVEGALAGLATYGVSPLEKLRHKAHMFEVYVHPAWRRRGVGRGLLRHVVLTALQSLDCLLCSVATTNAPALALFVACGFQRYGMEARGMRDAQGYEDLLLLRCDRS